MRPTRGSHLEDEFRRVPLGVREVGRIAATGEPLRIADVTRDDTWIARPEWVRSEGIQSFAGHALTFRDEVMGVLAVFDRAAIDARAFESLRAFAAQTAVAIANARAFDEEVKLRKQLALERDYLREELRAARAHGAIIGESTALKTVLEQIELVAPTDANVLILGEPGTGKEVVAQAIHEHSGRAQARTGARGLRRAAARTLRERALRPRARRLHRRGARPRRPLRTRQRRDAVPRRGRRDPARSCRRSCCASLQEGSFERIGEDRTRNVDVRVIAATNRDLRGEVAAGRFREDLYYRLAVFPIEVPPLRHRRDDIGRLAAAFLASAAQRLGKPGLRLTAADLRALERRDWPGNVRELQSVIERAAILARGARLDLAAALPPPSGRDGARRDGFRPGSGDRDRSRSQAPRAHQHRSRARRGERQDLRTERRGASCSA